MAEGVATAGLTLAWVWLLLLIPLPWLVRHWLSPASRAGLQALRVPWFDLMTDGRGGWVRKPVLAVMASVAWVLLVVAAARPQWVGEIETLQVPAMIVNVIFARDFAVGGNVDAAGDLVGNRVGHAAVDDLGRVWPEVGHRLFPGPGRIRGIAALGAAEPVRQLDVIGFRIGSDAGGHQRHVFLPGRISLLCGVRTQAARAHESRILAIRSRNAKAGFCSLGAELIFAIEFNLFLTCSI